MSILIKGMKMPKACYECRVLYDCRVEQYHCYSCKITGARIDYDRCDKERLADCPLIELPDHPAEGEIDKWWERSETINAERSEE